MFVIKSFHAKHFFLILCYMATRVSFLLIYMINRLTTIIIKNSESVADPKKIRIKIMEL